MNERADTQESLLGDVDDTLGAESAHMRDAIARRLFGEEADPPAQIGRYEIEGRLGRGAMGSVFAARDPNLGRTIALKVLHRAARAAASDAYVTRLLREAKLLAKLTHPNVVAVYDVGEEDGVVHIAMELVRGRTLRAWTERHPPRTRAQARALVELYEQAARGLAAAHAAGVVHRDFKPDNVLVGDDGRVRVADFGLAVGRVDAHVSSRDEDASTEAPIGAPSATLTATGQLVGTPAYMAPEQFAGEDVGPAADQYALCVALYEGLYGRRPFEAKSVQALAHLVVEGEIVIPSAPHVAAGLRAVLRRGLAREPARRFADMRELGMALHRASTGWRRWALGGAVLSAALGGAAVSQLLVPGASLCTGARDRIETVWNASRREEVKRAFEATGLAWKDTAAERAITALDELARAWPVEHRAACEATRVRGEQSEEVLDRRIACLDGQLRATSALVDVLASADSGVVEHVDALIGRLPAVDRCARVDDLLDKDPLPADPDTRAMVQALEARLDRIDALEAAGKLDECTAEEAGLVEAAEATGHRPTIAHAWSLRAAVAQLRRDPDAVTEATRRAITVALGASEDELASRLAVQLASHHATILQQPAEAVTWAELGIALAERTGGSARVRALAFITAGHALQQLGEHDEALRMAERGAEIFRETDPRSAAHGRALADLAGVHANQGRVERARPMMVEAIEILSEALGREHPDVAQDMMNLAAIDVWRGDAEGARQSVDEAIAILEAALGPNNLRVSDALEILGAAELKLGEHESAAAHFERGLEIRRATLGADHRTLMRPLENYASTLVQIGKPERARAIAEDAARVLEAIAQDDPERVRKSITVGYLLYVTGAKDEGLALAEQGIVRLAPDRLGARDFELVSRYGSMLRDAGRVTESVDWFVRAMETVDAQTGALAPDRASTRLRLAEALWDVGDERPRAIALATEAKAILDPFADSSVALAREIDTWLAAHPG
jgi:tetratricopeptide (TPR) repeat protein/predicted Ser/Thr protein kinase